PLLINLPSGIKTSQSKFFVNIKIIFYVYNQSISVITHTFYNDLPVTKLTQYDPHQFSRYTALLVSRCALLTLKRELV
uniref:hypothetical protein n=1 Tax=Yersinia massiliensis TaxID=419257 RepID=UPI001C95F7A2